MDHFLSFDFMKAAMLAFISWRLTVYDPQETLTVDTRLPFNVQKGAILVPRGMCHGSASHLPLQLEPLLVTTK